MHLLQLNLGTVHAMHQHCGDATKVLLGKSMRRFGWLRVGQSPGQAADHCHSIASGPEEQGTVGLHVCVYSRTLAASVYMWDMAK